MAAPTRDTSTQIVPIRPPVGGLGQLSRSDARRYSDGRTLPDDYALRLMNPQQRMALFEEMRSDDAINTPLTAREQMIQAANWMLGSEDETPQGREILEFCEDNVYPLLDTILEQLAGALQYGFAAIEPCYVRASAPVFTNVARGKIRRAAKSKGDRIYLQKIARIRQRSIWYIAIEDNGDLKFLDQYAYAGTAFVRIQLPPEKLIMWTYRQRGDDYWGYPPTRNCYKAWDYKSQLERLSVLGFDRFGVGTPVVVGGETWGEQEYKDAFEYIKRLRVGEESGLVTPPGASASLVGGEGSVSSAMLDHMKWYAIACAKSFMTQGMELGSTDTGARSLGETFLDQSEGIAQADCEQIAQLLNEKLLVPLVQWNFGPQASYPTFNPSQRVRRQGAVATVIQTLVAAGAIKLDAKDEAWLRDQLGMHDIDVKARQLELDAKQQQTDALAQKALETPAPSGTTGSGSGSDRGAAGATRSSDQGGSKPLAIAAIRTLTMPDPAAAGETHRTQAFTDWELGVVKPIALGRELDLATARLTSEVQTVLQLIDADLAAQVDRLAGDGHDALAELASLRVPDGLRDALRQVLLGAMQRAYERGTTSIEQELERQRSPDVAAPARFARAIRLGAAKLRHFFRDPAADAAAAFAAELRAQVERAVQDECDRREAAARSAATLALQSAPAVTPDELRAVATPRVKSALEDLSSARTQDNVSQVVNAGFGAGRREAIDTAVTEDDIASLVYSAVLDDNTCSECARWDGASFPADYDQDAPGAVKCPNPKCAGGARCRCLWVAVLKSEAPSAVGPTRGPEYSRSVASSPVIHMTSEAPVIHIAPPAITVHAHIEKSGGVRTSELTNARGEKSIVRTVEE